MSPGVKGGYENQSKNPSVGCRETEGLQNTGLGPPVPGAATAVVGARAGGSGMSRPGSRAMLDDLHYHTVEVAAAVGWRAVAGQSDTSQGSDKSGQTAQLWGFGSFLQTNPQLGASNEPGIWVGV